MVNGVMVAVRVGDKTGVTVGVLVLVGLIVEEWVTVGEQLCVGV